MTIQGVVIDHFKAEVLCSSVIGMDNCPYVFLENEQMSEQSTWQLMKNQRNIGGNIRLNCQSHKFEQQKFLMRKT